MYFEVFQFLKIILYMKTFLPIIKKEILSSVIRQYAKMHTHIQTHTWQKREWDTVKRKSKTRKESYPYSQALLIEIPALE